MPTRKKRGSAALKSSDASGSSGQKKLFCKQKPAFCFYIQHVAFPLCFKACSYHTSPCPAAQESQSVFGAFDKQPHVFSRIKAKSARFFANRALLYNYIDF
jgi:hypothetical protein